MLDLRGLRRSLLQARFCIAAVAGVNRCSATLSIAAVGWDEGAERGATPRAGGSVLWRHGVLGVPPTLLSSRRLRCPCADGRDGGGASAERRAERRLGVLGARPGVVKPRGVSGASSTAAQAGVPAETSWSSSRRLRRPRAHGKVVGDTRARTRTASRPRVSVGRCVSSPLPPTRRPRRRRVGHCPKIPRRRHRGCGRRWRPRRARCAARAHRRGQGKPLPVASQCTDAPRRRRKMHRCGRRPRRDVRVVADADEAERHAPPYIIVDREPGGVVRGCVRGRW